VGREWEKGEKEREKVMEKKALWIFSTLSKKYRREIKKIREVYGTLTQFLTSFSSEKTPELLPLYRELKGKWQEDPPPFGSTLSVGFTEEGYPEELFRLSDPPVLLFYEGTPLSSLPRPFVVLVGTRLPSPYGRRMAEKLTEELVLNGVTIVSGLARGIDGIVLKTAVERGGVAVAVLPSGLDKLYPPEHRNLAKEIVERGGTVLTEYPPFVAVNRYHFPERNRVMAGLSDGIVVVEGTERSGSLITASFGLDIGVPVFAVPGRVGDRMASGPLKLLSEGALLALDGLSILTGIGFKGTIRRQKEEGEKPSFSELLEEDGRRVLELLNDTDPVHLEEIFEKTSFSFPYLSELLLKLEIQGLVQSLPGSFYIRGKRAFS